MNKSTPQNGIKEMSNLQSPKETLRSKLLRLRPGDTITLTPEEAEIYGVDVADRYEDHETTEILPGDEKR
ncbi:hypothetical protein ACS126_03310 [Sphingobacterium lactis]|uniref:hypothetical protein n=1 Tax=Sphingobacterium TaxID=28453 RepID=UPI0021A7C286|nr:hypothetical protein [Sphingobacterium hotanense]MCT1525819.1 hypothetical protein [Sphingobacterium hotanense]